MKYAIVLTIISLTILVLMAVVAIFLFFLFTFEFFSPLRGIRIENRLRQLIRMKPVIDVSDFDELPPDRKRSILLFLKGRGWVLVILQALILWLLSTVVG